MRSETEQAEQNIIKKSKEDFSIILSKMIGKSANEIHEVKKLYESISNLKDNQRIAEIYCDYQNQLTEQLNLTKDKMFEVHNKFINEIKS